MRSQARCGGCSWVGLPACPFGGKGFTAERARGENPPLGLNSGRSRNSRYRGPFGGEARAYCRSAQTANLQSIRVEPVNEQPSCARLGRPGGLPYNFPVI